MQDQLILVTGAAGFVGTNLVRKLLDEGAAVIGVDSLVSSERWKADLYKDESNYEFLEWDIVGSWDVGLEKSRLLAQFGKIDQIYNLACIASPPLYQANSLGTIWTSTIGVSGVLELAKKYDAKILQASTSEVYGDPEVHPQKEDYVGHVNQIGPRACYDESKRLGETLCFEYRRLFEVDVKIIRIFNTYGPYMDMRDGRVVSNFICQALRGEDLTIYGDGSQTRSFQYVDDLVAGMRALMATEAGFMGPVNIGNPGEFTILELAELVLEKITSDSQLKHLPAAQDDPKRRRPDISLAKDKLGWEPRVSLGEGLDKTIPYFREQVEKADKK